MIYTERLMLKSPHEVTGKEVSEYYIRNRQFLTPFQPIKEKGFYTEAYQEEFLKIQRKEWDEQSGFRFYICRKEQEKEIIGNISLSNIVRGGFWSCFIGCGLDERYVNHGYMTEATNRVVRFGFDELGLHRIEANIMPRNKPSRAVVKKCHFVEEGISKKYLKINGVWEDHLHYVILNEKME